MTLKGRKKWGVVMGAAFVATVAVLPQAKGELVYENNKQAAVHAEQTEDRETLRQAIQSSEKAQTQIHAAPVAPAQMAPAPVAPAAAPQMVTAPAVVVAPAPVAPAPVPAVAEPAPSVENMSKAELLRRERMRTELKNEDVLQERLEELRLRDEKTRMDSLSGTQAAPAPQAQTVAPAAMTQETVVAPVTEKPGTANAATAGDGKAMLAAPAGAPAAAPAATSTAAVTAEAPSEDELTLSVMPRFGLSNFTTNTGFDIRPRYSVGLTAGIGVAENLTIELGYTYNEFGVRMNPSNPWVAMANTNYMWWGANQNNFTYESQVFKQNVFEAGAKVQLLGKDSKFRPFIGGGGGYAQSYLNYSQRILNNLNTTAYNQNGLTQDYDISSFLGYLSTGFDVKVSKSVSLGLLFKYYTVLSARENGTVNNQAFYGYGYGYAYGMPPAANMDYDKSRVGGSLAFSSFYSVAAGVSFNF